VLAALAAMAATGRVMAARRHAMLAEVVGS
jgi:hypothetical protein